MRPDIVGSLVRVLWSVGRGIFWFGAVWVVIVCVTWPRTPILPQRVWIFFITFITAGYLVPETIIEILVWRNLSDFRKQRESSAL
jgi:hypothetical protein